MSEFIFSVIGKDGTADKMVVDIKANVIIGFAGRDIEKTKEHIKELAVIGVKEPKTIPEIYRTPLTVTQSRNIDCCGNGSSGELEFGILQHKGELYVCAASDHTDRAMEGYNTIKSKAVCGKPIGFDMWRYEDIKDHWDDLRMISWQVMDGKEELYQDGTASAILPFEKLVQSAKDAIGDIEDVMIFSGTVPLLHGLVYGTNFRAEIVDEILNRKLHLNYAIHVLPDGTED